MVFSFSFWRLLPLGTFFVSIRHWSDERNLEDVTGVKENNHESLNEEPVMIVRQALLGWTQVFAKSVSNFSTKVVNAVVHDRVRSEPSSNLLSSQLLWNHPDHLKSTA